MADTTKIEWTDSTFNPWIGCTNISPGCDHCYAEQQNSFRGWTQWGPHGERRRTSVTNWKNPRAWNAGAAKFQLEHGRRQRVFCASLADVFDNKAPREWRDDLFALIRETPALDWQLLSKRPQNFAKFLPADWGDGYPNVWLGVTAEDQEYYDQRWPILAATPAAVRFISYEPAVGPIISLITGGATIAPNWLISGGESGPKARVADPKWFRDIQESCADYGVAFFHKQYGIYRSNPLMHDQQMTASEAAAIDPPSNGKGGGLLAGRLWREFPLQL